MKKIFGFFTTKHKSNKLIKILIAVAVLIALAVGSVVLISSRKELDLKAISKNLNTYNIELEYNENKSFTATQKLSFTNRTSAILDHLSFNLYPAAFAEGAVNKPVSVLNVDKAYPNGLSYGGIEITEVLVNGLAVEYEREGLDKNVLKVLLKNELDPYKKLEVNIHFSFALPNTHHRFGYGANTINVANFYPILGVYENGDFICDPYNSNGDPFYSDMSNYNVKLTVPNKFVVAHTGTLSKTSTQDESKTLEINALAVRDFAFVMSEKFTVLEDVYNKTTIKYYYYNDQDAAKSLQASVDSIKTFSEMFGTYPYETYSVVETNFVHGGMEFPQLSYISDATDRHSDYLNIIIHETAHQWWYQLVGSNAYRNPWLDEGLTEFTTVMFYEKNPSYNVNANEIIANATNSYVSFVELCESLLGSVDTSMNRALNEYDTEPEYVYVTYVKGMLLFDSLRDAVGQTNFERALKTYFEENKFTNVTPSHLISVFEKVSLRDLNSFFNSWLEGKVLIKNFG